MSPKPKTDKTKKKQVKVKDLEPRKDVKGGRTITIVIRPAHRHRNGRQSA
jgi:hypothetical protein